MTQKAANNVHESNLRLLQASGILAYGLYLDRIDFNEQSNDLGNYIVLSQDNLALFTNKSFDEFVAEWPQVPNPEPTVRFGGSYGSEDYYVYIFESGYVTVLNGVASQGGSNPNRPNWPPPGLGGKLPPGHGGTPPGQGVHN